MSIILDRSGAGMAWLRRPLAAPVIAILFATGWADASGVHSCAVHASDHSEASGTESEPTSRSPVHAHGGHAAATASTTAPSEVPASSHPDSGSHGDGGHCSCPGVCLAGVAPAIPATGSPGGVPLIVPETASVPPAGPSENRQYPPHFLPFAQAPPLD